MKSKSNSLAFILTTLVATLFFTAAGQSAKKAEINTAQAGAAAAAVTPRERTPEAQAKMSPQDALAKLRVGNARFAAGQSRARNLPAEVRGTAVAQYPFAVVLSCLDSRAPVE